MSVELDRLTVEVTEMDTVVDSAIVLLQGLSERLAAIATDPAAINALADELDAKANTLSDAIVANTPAAKAPVKANTPFTTPAKPVTPIK